MDVVGRYHVIERIGAGQVAETFRAYDVSGAGIVRAVDFERPTSREAESVFVEGAKICAALKHENITRVLDIDRDAVGPYAVKESIFGRSLATLLERSRGTGVAIDPMAAMYIGVQLAAGLAHVHQRTSADGMLLQIVHRDLSPASVAIGYGGEVRIDGFYHSQTTRRTSPPALARYSHSSPELASGGIVDHRSDIFSLGLILWELLAGQPAYPSDPDEGKARASRGVVAPIAEAAPHVPPGLVATIERALVVDPNQRHPSAAVFRDELARLLYGSEPTYSGARLASIVSMVLGTESADDRRRDAAAVKQLASSEVQEFTMAGPLSAPAPGFVPSLPVSAAPVSAAPVSAPLSARAVPTAKIPTPERTPDPAPVAPRRPTPLPSSIARAQTDQYPSAPEPTHLPDIDGRQLPLGKIFMSVAAIGVIAAAVFAFSSERNTRVASRKMREAFLGRNPGGVLTIESIPPGALVTLDDEDTGRRTPLTIENLESERVHRLELSIEGEKTESSTVSILAGQKKTVNVMFPGAVVSMSIKTIPEGSEVWMDGRSVALTPTSLSVRTKKDVSVAIKKIGYVPYEKVFTPEPSVPIDVDVTLEKTPELLAQEAEEAAAMKEMEAEASGKSGKKSRRRKRR